MCEEDRSTVTRTHWGEALCSNRGRDRSSVRGVNSESSIRSMRRREREGSRGPPQGHRDSILVAARQIALSSSQSLPRPQRREQRRVTIQLPPGHSDRPPDRGSEDDQALHMSSSLTSLQPPPVGSIPHPGVSRSRPVAGIRRTSSLRNILAHTGERLTSRLISLSPRPQPYRQPCPCCSSKASTDASRSTGVLPRPRRCDDQDLLCTHSAQRQQQRRSGGRPRPAVATRHRT